MWRKLFTLPLRRGYGFLNNAKGSNIKTGTSVLLLMNSAHLVNLENSLDENTIHFDNPFPLHDADFFNYNCELKQVGEKNHEAMRNLIRTLNSCIEEICEQYQHCVVKQIEITLTCMTLAPVGQHWDELTKYRVEADELKNEFLKYSMLVERIGQIIYAYGYTMENNEGSVDAITMDYEHLKGLIKQKNEENQYWDSKLLDANTESILTGAH